MKTLMRMAVLAVLGMASPTEAALAQTPALTQSSEIKVVLEDGREVRGQFREWVDDGLALNAKLGWGEGTPRTYEKGEVTEIWVKTGEESAAGRRLGGVAKATGIAVLVGAGIGYLSWDESDWLIRRDGYMLIGAIALGAPVAAIGLVYALLSKDEVWSPVNPAWVRSKEGTASGWRQSLDWAAGITPDGRLGLSLSLRR